MTEVAHGVIKIDVRDEDALASLRHLSNQVERELRDIDRQRAEAKATLDTSDIDKSVKDAERKLKQLERRKAKLKVDGDAYKRVTQQIKEAEKEVNSLSKAQQRAHAVRERNIKRLEVLETRADDVRAKAAEKQEKIELASKKRMAAAEEKEHRASVARQRQRDRDFAKSDREMMQRLRAREREAAKQRTQEARDASRREREESRAAAALQREIDMLPRLRAEYVRAAAALQSFDAKRRTAVRSRDPIKVAQVEFDFKAAEARMEQIRARLQRIGEPPPEIDLHISPGRRLGEQLREVYKERGTLSASQAFGAALGTNVLTGFRKRFNRQTFARENMIAMGGGALSAAFSKFGSLASSLSSATVRIGPFTATIRQALVGLAALGPIIVDVVGALGALGSVTGSAVAGLGALSVGALGGAIPAMIGMATVIKPVVGEFKNAMKASKAYDDALRKGNTDLAAKKMKEMKAVLGNVDEETVKNFRSASKLSGRWAELTKPGRASVFQAIGDGLGFASKNAGMFAKHTNESLKVTAGGVRRIFRNMGSKEGTAALSEMMGNFNETLKPALNGVANLGVYLGRVGRVASGFLPGMGRSFEAWTGKLAAGAADSDKLKQKITGVVESLKSVGRFMMAGGRLMKAFFGGGVDEGRKFVDTMTNAMNRWTAFLNTRAGQEKLSDFFSRSVSGAQALYAALAPIASSFVGWASALSPIVSTFFKAAGAVGNLVAEILRMTALKGPLMALAATMGTLWAVGKIGAAVAMVGNFTRALLGLRAAYAATGAAGAASGLMTALGGGAAAAGGAKAAANASRLGTALNVVSGAAALAGGRMAMLNRSTSTTSTTTANAGKNVSKAGGLLSRFGGFAAGAGGALAAFGARFALPVAGAGALGYAVGGLTGNLLGMNDKVNASKSGLDKVKAGMEGAEAATAALSQVTRGGGAAYREIQRASLGVAAARERLNQLQAAGLGKTTEGKVAALDLADAEDQLNGRLNERAVISSKLIASLGRRIQGAKELKEAGLFEAKDHEQQKRNIAAYNNALENHQGILVNNQRAMRGLGEYTRQGTQEVGKFVRGFKDVPNARKLVVEAKTEDAGRKVAKLSNDLARTGQRKTAVNIVANSKNADQALSRLRRQKSIQQRVDIVTRGGPQALSMIRKLVGAKLAPKVLRILGSDSSARQKVAALKALGIDPKTLKILGDIAHAQAAARRAEATKLSPLQQLINRVIGQDQSRTPVGSIVQLVHRKIVGGGGGKGGGLFGADGAVFASRAVSAATGATPDRDRINRAREEAKARGVRDIRKGGRVSRPTILAGEENRTEFVIPTNPRYRERALMLMAQAARSLGMRREARGERGAPYMLAAALGTAPSLGVRDYSKAPTFSNRKTQKQFRTLRNKKRKKFKGVPGNPWVARLNSLDTQQNDLEREAQLRASSVREPDDFIIESKNPTTGDTVYSFDKTTYDAWVAQMAQVRAVYESLQRVVQEIYEVIPKAREFANAQIAGNARNIAILQGQIARERKKKGGSEATKKKRQARIERLTKNLDKQKDQIRQRREFRKGLGERAKEASFDYREYGQQVSDINFDIGDRKADAAKDIAGNNAQTSGSGGGGSDQLSYGQQVAASAAQQQRVLAEHGSNLSVATGGGSPPSASTDTPQNRLFGGGGLAAAGASLSATGVNTQSAVMATGGSTTGAAGAAMAGSLTSSGGAQAAGMAAAPGGAPAVGGDTVVNVNNTFNEPPPDPHIWSKGVEYEMGAIL